MTEYILRLIILIPVIGGLAWASLWMWKRLNIGMTGPANGQTAVCIEEVVPLGVGCKLAVVEFSGRQLLISVTKTDIRLIADAHD